MYVLWVSISSMFKKEFIFGCKQWLFNVMTVVLRLKSFRNIFIVLSFIADILSLVLRL